MQVEYVNVQEKLQEMDENWFCVEKQTIQYMPQSFKQTKKAYLEHWATNMIFVKRFYAEKPEPETKLNIKYEQKYSYC